MPLLTKIIDAIVNPIVGLMFGVALVLFLVGVVQFIQGADSPDKRSTGARHMVWGVVGLFIMVSVFGIMNIVCTTIGCK